MKRIFLSPWLSLLTLSLIIGLRIFDPSFIESVRLRYFDTLITSQPQVISDNIEIVNIDDATIKQYGQYPFPRDKYVDIIAELYNRNAGLVVFNVFMPDEDRFGKDKEFRNLLQNVPLILPQVAINDNIDFGVGFNPGVAEIGESAKPWTPTYRSIHPSIFTASGVGVVNTIPEIDGVVRRLPMLITANDILYPSLALETLRVAAGDPSFQVKTSESGIEAVRIPQYGKITTDEYGRIWIDWSHRSRSFSFTELPESFNGKIVIVGVSGRGLNNPVGTSIGEQYPHDLQGAILDTIISGSNISRPDWSTIAEIGFTVLLSIISILLVRWKYGFIPVLFAISSLYFICGYIFDTYKFLIDCTIPILGISFVYSHSFTVKFITELNAKLQIKKQFGGYVSPFLVEKLQKNPELIKLGGEKKELSVVMTDMRNFTALGESYGDDVQEFTKIMNLYMDYISNPILDNGGCLIKFIGDASLHVHGAPLDDINHAKSAVKTGLDMLDAVKTFNKFLADQGKPPVGMGVGVNTGQTLIGNIGSKKRFGYDVLGDTVSLASRLEGQSKPYGVGIIIGSITAEHIKDEYFTLKLDKIAVKGKAVGVDIYTVIPESSSLDYKLLKIKHDKMLELYVSKQWKDAALMCHELIGEFDGTMDKYYNMMIERITEYEYVNKPPIDWDGTFIATSK